MERHNRPRSRRSLRRPARRRHGEARVRRGGDIGGGGIGGGSRRGGGDGVGGVGEVGAGREAGAVLTHEGVPRAGRGVGREVPRRGVEHGLEQRGIGGPCAGSREGEEGRADARELGAGERRRRGVPSGSGGAGDAEAEGQEEEGEEEAVGRHWGLPRVLASRRRGGGGAWAWRVADWQWAVANRVEQRWMLRVVGLRNARWGNGTPL